MRAAIDTVSTVSTTTGSISVAATDSATIVADSGGFAIAAAESAGGGSFSLSIGASFSVNSIRANVYADVASSTIDANQALTVAAEAHSSIRAVTITGAVSAGLASGPSVNLSGAGAVAVNSITDEVIAAVRAGSNARARGGLLSVTALDNTKINTDGGAVALSFAASAGTSLAGAIGASLAFNDIANTARAMVDFATVNADAGLLVSGRSTSRIESATFGLAGSLAGGSNGGFALSGAGAASTNFIHGTIEGLVKSGSTVTAGGTGAVVNALDDSTINTSSGAIAVAAAVAQNGASLAIGVSASYNTIDNEVNAGVDGSTFTVTGATGKLTLAAEVGASPAVGEEAIASIAAKARAATIAAAGGGNNGVALSGGGAVAHNVILSDTHSYFSNSTISATDDIALSAKSKSRIEATLDTLAVALAEGGTGAGGAAIGASVARNYIGYKSDGSAETSETDAYLFHSSLGTTGALALTALADQRINTKVVAGAVAVAGGGSGGAAGAGSGSSAVNKIAGQTRAYVDGTGAADVHAKSLTISAKDTAQITSDVRAAAIAVSFAPDASVSLAIGVALSENSIADQIAASIKNAANLSTSLGAITLTAKEEATITAKSVAAAAAGSFSLAGLALSGGAATANNTISGSTTASIEGSALVNSKTGVSLAASNTATMSATIDGNSLAGGLVGIAIGVAVTNNTVNDTVTASIVGSTVTAQSGDIAVNANANTNITSETFVSALSASIGAAGAGAKSNVLIDGIVDANVSGGTLTATGNVTIGAQGIATANPQTKGLAGGLAAVAVMDSDANIRGTTRAYAGGATTITAGGAMGLSITATDISVTNPKTTVVGVGGVTGAGISAKSTASRTTEAYIANGANIVAGLKPVSLSATSTSTVKGETLGASVAGVAVSALIIDSTVNGTTRAFVGDAAHIAAGELSVLATATNTVSTPATVFGLGLATGSGVKATAKDLSKTLANIGPEIHVGGTATAAQVTLATGNAVIRATTVSTVSSNVDALNLGLAATVSSTNATALSAPETQAFLGYQATLTSTAGLATVEALSTNTATARSSNDGGSALNVSVSKLQADANGITKAQSLGEVTAGGTILVNARGTSVSTAG